MEVTVTFIGNATTLISGGGVTLLTDPNFLHRGQHAYLGYGLVSKRLREPAIDIDELPPLEAVVLSHMHGDHWDRRATTELDHELPVLTTPDAAKRLTAADSVPRSGCRRGSRTRSSRTTPSSPSPRFRVGTHRRRCTGCCPRGWEA